MPSTLWVLRMASERFHRDVAPRPADDATLADETVDALALVRSAYAGARGGYAPDALDIWRVSQLASAVPWFFTLRAPAGSSPELPPYAASLAQATRVTGMLGHRLVCRILDGQPSTQLTAASLVRLAEKTDLEVDPRICEALVSGRPTSASQIGALAAHLDGLLLFGANYAGLKLAIWVHHLARRFLYADLVAARGETPELRALLDEAIEPPGCFLVEPAELTVMAPAARAAWFGELAALAVPLALDSSDVVIRDALRRVATAMGEPHGRDPVAHAATTFATLDTVFGEILAMVEYGLRRACGAEATTEPFDAVARDQLGGTSPRAYLAALRSRA